MTTTEMIVIDVGFRPREVADRPVDVADTERSMAGVRKRVGPFPAIMCIAQLCALVFGGFARSPIKVGLERF